MKSKFAKLIDVKSIVTLVLTGVFAYLAIVGAITADNYKTIFTLIIALYFGTQTAKQSSTEV